MIMEVNTALQEQIAKFCRRNRITRLALLGDTVRRYPPLDKHIKVLVEFEPEYTPGLALFRMQDELTEIMRHDVDLNTPGWINAAYREQALAEAQDVYVAT